MSHCLRCDQERERERERGTGILFEEPNPTGSRPRDLIGLYRIGKRDPNRRLFKRETEHLCLSQTSKDKPFVFIPSFNPPLSRGLIGSCTDIFLSLLQREPSTRGEGNREHCEPCVS